MRKIVYMLVIIFLLCVFVGCSNKGNDEAKEMFESSNDKVSETDNDKNEFAEIQSLMQEDLDYFFKFAKENFALYGLLERNGFDFDLEYENYCNEIKNCYTYNMFYHYVMEPISALFSEYGTPHTCVMPKSAYESNVNLYGSVVDNTDSPQCKLILDVLYSAKDFYGEYVYTPSTDTNTQTSTTSNWLDLTYEIIKEDKIAYIKMPQMQFNDGEEEKLVEFLNSVSNYENIIIDIRGNGGGNSKYMYPFIYYLSDETLEYSAISVCNFSEYNSVYIESYASDVFKITEDVDLGENFIKEDLAYVDSYFTLDLNVEKNEELYNGFDGEVYLLIDDSVFSSAEIFTTFCKDSGFATIVGQTNSKGDGIGTDPYIFALPNSNIVWRYTNAYGLNQDGTNNAEFGTTPDIFVPADQDELEFLVNLIMK